MLKKPYVIYADFESIVEPVPEERTNKRSSKTKNTHLHEPSSYGLVCIRSDNKIIGFDIYRGIIPIERFYDNLDIIGNFISRQESTPIKISSIEEEQFQTAKVCYLCDTQFNDDKVRDHDHITGKYRGAAHNSCNLQLKPDKNIPVVIHNFRGYDSHLIINKLNRDANVIANNK